MNFRKWYFLEWLIFLEVGLLWVFLPWAPLWDGIIRVVHASVANVLLNPIFRGGVSGFGLYLVLIVWNERKKWY